MPRMNLTDEEALVIEKFRAKHARTLAYNEGVEKALDWVHTWMDEAANSGGVYTSKELHKQGLLLCKLEVKA